MGRRRVAAARVRKRRMEELYAMEWVWFSEILSPEKSHSIGFVTVKRSADDWIGV